MTVPVFQAVGNQSAGTGAISVVWPTHVIDDFALLVIETSGNGTTLTPPSGWTTLTPTSSNVDLPTVAGSILYIWYKFATSAAEAAVSVADSGDHQIARIYTFRNVNRQNPFHTTNTNVSSAVPANGTLTFNSLGSNIAEPLAVYVCSRVNDSNSTANFTVFSQDFTNNGAVINRGEGGSNAGNGGGFALFTGASLLNRTVLHNFQVTTALSTTSVLYTILLRQKIDIIQQNFHFKNWIENNTNVGAIVGDPGTLPTGWAFDGSGLITRQILGTGTQNGIPYIDIKFSSATSIVNEYVPVLTLHNTPAPLSYDSFRDFVGYLNYWILGLNLEIIDFQGSNNPKNSNFRITTLDTIGSGSQTSLANTFYDSALNGEPQGVGFVPFTTRRSVLLSFPFSSSAKVSFKVRLDFSFGSAGYITLRIGLPSLINSTGTVEPTDLIGTSGTALEAPNNNQFFPAILVKRSAEVGSFTVTGQPAEIKKTKYAINAEAGNLKIGSSQDSYQIVKSTVSIVLSTSFGIDIDPVTKRIYFTHRFDDSFRNFRSYIIEPNLLDLNQVSSNFSTTSQLFNGSTGGTVFSSQLGYAYAFFADQGGAGNPPKLVAASLATPVGLSAYRFGYGDSSSGRSLFSAATVGPDGSFYISGRNDVSPIGGFLLKLNPADFSLIWGIVTLNETVFQQSLKVSGDFVYTLNFYSSNSDIKVTKRNTSDGSPSREVLLTSTFNTSITSSCFIDVDQLGNVYALLQGGAVPALRIYKLDSNLNVLFTVNLLQYVPSTTDPGSDYDLPDLVTGFKVINDQNILLTGVKNTVNQNVLIFNLDLSNENNILLKYINRITYASGTTRTGQIQQYDDEHFIINVSNTVISSNAFVYKLKIDGSDVGSLNYSNVFTNLYPQGSDPNTTSYAGSTTSTSPIGTSYYKVVYNYSGSLVTNDTVSKSAFNGNAIAPYVTFVYTRKIKFNAQVGSYNITGVANTFVIARKIKFNAEVGSHNVYHSTNNRRYFNIHLNTSEPLDFVREDYLVRDSSGNLYILIENSGKFSVVKYSKDGEFQWASKINNISLTCNIVLNGDGTQLFVSVVSNEFKAAIFRIDPLNGSIIWQQYYNTQDASNNICFNTNTNTLYLLCNNSLSASGNCRILEINPSNGLATTSYVTNFFSSGRSLNIEIDNAGNYYLFFDTSGLNNSTRIVKLDGAFNVLWSREHRISGNIGSKAFDFAFDSSNNLYLIGARTTLTYITKINGSTGASLWFKVYSFSIVVDSFSYSVYGNCIRISSNGTIYGLSSGSDYNLFYEISSSTGALSSLRTIKTFGYKYQNLLLDSNSDLLLLGTKSSNNDGVILTNTSSSSFPDDIVLANLKFDTGIIPNEITALTLSLNSFTTTLTLDSALSTLYDRTLTSLNSSIEIYNQDIITPTALFRGRPFRADGGSYTINGQQAITAKLRTLDADFTNFNLTGQSVEFLTNAYIDAQFGVYSISGQTININRSVNSQSGSIILTGNDSSFAYGRVFNAELGILLLSGQDSTLTKINRYKFNVEHGNLSLSGKEASIYFNPTLIANNGYYGYNGADSSLSYDYKLNAEFGNFSYIGNQANLFNNKFLSLEFGNYNLNGQDANLTNNQNLNLESGFYILTGQDATLSKNKILNSEFGIYSYFGQLANLIFDHQLNIEEGFYQSQGQFSVLRSDKRLNLESGSYILTGQDSLLNRSNIFNAESGSVLLIGQDSTFVYDRVPLIDPGGYSLLGQDSTFVRSRSFNTEVGSFSISGQEVDFLRSRIFDSEFGTFDLSGQDSSLVAYKAINAESGSFVLTGQNATQLLVKSVLAQLGQYDISGQDADLDVRAADQFLIATPEQLIINGQPITVVRTIVFIVESGSYNYTGQNANISIDYKLQSDLGVLNVIGQNNLFIYNYAILAQLGVFSLSGLESTLSRTYQFNADSGFYDYVGSEALLSRAREFSADFGLYSLIGQNSLLRRTISFDVDAEQYIIVGEPTLLIESLVLQTELGEHYLTGIDNQLIFDRKPNTESGHYLIFGQNSEFVQDLVFGTESGSFSISGQETYFYRGYSLSSELGSFVSTGEPANLVNYKVLDSQFGEYEVNGLPSQFIRNYVFTAEFGEYSISGQPSVDVQAGRLNAEFGEYQIFGQNSVLSQTDIFSADLGFYTISGQDANLIHDQIIISNQESFVLFGQNTTLSKNNAIQAELGEYNINGFDTDLDNDQILDADFTDYFTIGEQADLSRTKQLNSLSGQIIVTGFDVSYYRTYALESFVGDYDILGQDADIFQGAGAADPGQYGITGQYAYLNHNKILGAESNNYAKSYWADPNYVDPNYAFGTDAKLKVIRRVYPFAGSYLITGHAAVIDYDSVGELSDIIYKLLANRQELDPINGKFRIYDNDNVTILLESNAWADAEGTIPFNGGVLRRIDKLLPP